MKKIGHQVDLFGPLKGEAMGWLDVGESVALEVRGKRADQGILFCWTGTGETIAANKVPGFVRLCVGTLRLRKEQDCGMMLMCSL